MSVSEALQAGFALAATIARDAGADHAHIGIARDVSDAWCGLARDLEQASKAERRVRILELTQLTQRRVAERNRPSVERPPSPRALALLAGRAPRAAAPRVALGPGTMPRPGFSPDPLLLALLSRIARRTAAP